MLSPGYGAQACPSRAEPGAVACCWSRPHARRQYCQGLVDYDQVRAAAPQMFASELEKIKQDQGRSGAWAGQVVPGMRAVSRKLSRCCRVAVHTGPHRLQMAEKAVEQTLALANKLCG